MQGKIVETSERRLRIVTRDSMGRTKEQVEAMEANEAHLRRPVKMSEADANIHEIVREEQSEYPRVLYEAAVTVAGVPCGDLVHENYPVPFDLAAAQGLDSCGFKVVGKKRDDGGHIAVRYPWKTIKCVVLDNPADLLTVNVEKSRELERKLRAAGAVDHPSKLKLPDSPIVKWFFNRTEPVELWKPGQDLKPEKQAARG